MRVVATKVPEEVYGELRRRAESEGVSVSELLRRLIYEHLGVEGKPSVNHGKPLRVEVEELRRRVEELEGEVARLRKAVYSVVTTLDIMKRGAGREATTIRAQEHTGEDRG